MRIEIIEREDNYWKRGIKESIHIRKHNPQLNKEDDRGRYKLPHIYDIVKPKNLPNGHPKLQKGEKCPISTGAPNFDTGAVFKRKNTIMSI